MKKSLFLALLLVTIKSYGQWYNTIPPVTIPYIPVQKAAPVNIDYDAEITKLRIEAEAKRAELVVQCSNQTEEFYKSFTSYPALLIDGWYKVRAVSKPDLCDERLVYVKGSKITRWFVEEMYEKQVELSSPIERGIATVKVGGSYVKCYFFDNLLDASAKASAPQFGSVSFYTNYSKLRGSVMIYMDGLFVGKLEGYYGSGVPACDQQYTVNVMKKPGLYNFTAKNEKIEWNGQVQVTNGACLPYLLREK